MHLFVLRSIRAWLAAAALTLSVACLAAPVALPSFHIDIHQTTVSGLSSGGFMAVQFGVTWSSIVKGVGVIAGGPYYCAQGDLDIATRKCSCTGIFPFSSCAVAPGATRVQHLIDVTARNAATGRIDPISNIAHQRIWMFSGTLDSVVPTPVMDDLYTYYRHYTDAANIRYRNDIHAEHAMPTETYGNACTSLGEPYLGKCRFDAAGALLNWTYGGNLQPKRSQGLGGRFIEFDQTEFVDGGQAAEHGLADSGYAYVPAECEGSAAQTCRLHVALHGCLQNYATVGDKFIRHAGYNPWADTNRIIVLYPQTRAEFASNPNACWNWFDFDHDDPDYADRNGIQIKALKRMVDRVAGITSPPPASVPRCFTSSNAGHVQAGRAHDWFFLARANGSDTFMGPDTAFWSTTLKRTGPDYYDIGSCQ